ncbi:hypothetical protein VQ01_04940 [Tamlana sp. s12]|nr:hypothetical protein VQ01_04940 [Tamlana sp. s12]
MLVCFSRYNCGGVGISVFSNVNKKISAKRVGFAVFYLFVSSVFLDFLFILNKIIEVNTCK